MNRAFIISGVAAIALAGTAVTASAFGKDHAGGPRGPRISFEEFDANSDGKVTPEEIQAHFKARFDAADSDGDGNLSADELATHATAQRADRMQQRMARMIERRDANGDGMLSAEEMQSGRRGDMFTRLDADADGAVSAEEFAQLAQRGPRGDQGMRQGGGHGEFKRGGGNCDRHGDGHGHERRHGQPNQ